MGKDKLGKIKRRKRTDSKSKEDTQNEYGKDKMIKRNCRVRLRRSLVLLRNNRERLRKSL